MTTTARRPLEGMLVLDLGQVYNGLYCGLLLGFMGARVLKLEPPEGDVVRRRKRDVEPYPLVMLNSNKESVVLDLKHPEGKALFLRLARKADVVVENFAAGVMDRLGLGWEVLRAQNPRLVYGVGNGFGLTGPYRDLPAMDLTIQAMSGIMNATGFPDRPPVKAGPAVSDFLAGVHLFAGIVGALLYRERTGQGQLVEVAMLEASIMALASALGALMDADGEVPERTGNRHPALAIAPYNVYATNDGYVAIFTASERHWHSLARVLGRQDLLERGMWVDVEHPRRGKTRVPISPIRLHGSPPAAVERPAPLLGQDTDRVLSELLGLRVDELAALFFFRAEDGIRGPLVTGVQTCALPISCASTKTWPITCSTASAVRWPSSRP